MALPLPLEMMNTGSKELRFSYLVIIIFCAWLFSYIFKIETKNLLGIFLGVYITYEIYNSKVNDNEDTFKVLSEKIDYLNFIIEENTKKQQTQLGLRTKSYIPGFESSSQIDSYLYLDPNLVNLLYSVRDYEKYADINYYKVLKLSNYILKLLYDMRKKDPEGNIALQDCARNFQTASQMVKTASNYFHTFIYSLPTDRIYTKKYVSSMKRYRLLTKRILDEMKKICDEQRKSRKISMKTVFIKQDYDGPKATDPNDDNLFVRFN